MNFYLSTESEGSFIVDASISRLNGKPYVNSTNVLGANPTNFTTLFIDIVVADTGLALVSGGNVTINSTSNTIVFSLDGIDASFNPYTITIQGASEDGNQTFEAETQLYKIPPRNDSGSAVRIDSLYGGIQTLQGSNTTWTPILPYSYYRAWGGNVNTSIDNLNTFKDQGYNIIHLVPDSGAPTVAYNFTQLTQYLDRMAEIGLWLMFDMRWSYQNLSWVQEQVDLVKNHPATLLWYTGDEPDGNGDPLNATKLAYDLIKTLDPYHPVSLCLNCYNFYFEDYSAGADILLADPYPISNNVTYSITYDTVCNATYGCCGCDDCKGNFEDISERLDLFTQYQSWLGGPPKTHWGVPQAFGNSSFWVRYPTADEEVVMSMLSINHDAKGIVMGDYPTAPDLMSITSSLSKVLVAPEVTSFVLGAQTTALPATGAARVAVAAWSVGSQMLVSITFLQYDDTSAPVSIALPPAASSKPSYSIQKSLWGGEGWKVQGNSLVKMGLSALEVELLILEVS